MYYVGIDVASKSSAVAVIDEHGEVIRQVDVATTEADLVEGLAGLGSVHAVVEASPLAEWVSRVLEEAGHRVDIIDARLAKRLMEARKKTDARDALTLARIVRSGWFRPVHRKTPQARLERSQLQARQGLVRTCRSMGNQVRGLLRAHGICLGHASQKQFPVKVRAVVAEREPALLPALEPLLGLYEQSLAQAEAMKRAMARQQRRDPLQTRLTSVPGVGTLTAKAFAATVDDPHRFERGEQVADYVGLTPGVNQSGDQCRRGAITRQGDHLLRWHLVEAAHSLLLRGPDCRLKRWARRLAEKKGGAKARVALARKLAIVLWRLWLTGERFDPEHGSALSVA